LKKNQQKARKKLKTLLARLNKKESIIKKANDAREWNDFLHDLETLLRDYERDLPEDVRNVLKNILQYTDTSPEMLTPSYEAAKTGLGQAISGIPLGATGGVSSSVIITGIVIGAVSAGASAYLITQSTQLTITNFGCDTFQLSNSPIQIPGLNIPSQPIPSGGGQTIDILPIEVVIDSREPRIVSLSSSGMSISFQVPGNLVDLRFDGMQILHQSHVAKFESGKHHELVIQCQ
jgi:hypothetical protein